MGGGEGAGALEREDRISPTMRGARPFVNKTEIQDLEAEMQGKYSLRNRAIVELGTRSGGRIGQLLGLKVKDVFQNGWFVPEIYFRRRVMKGRRAGHRIPFNPALRWALGRWLVTVRRRHGSLNPNAFLFPSRKGTGPIQPGTYWKIMHQAAAAAGLDPNVSTHSMRKFTAASVYENSGHCLVTTGQVLGHLCRDGSVDIIATVRYLSFRLEERAQRAILAL